MDLRRLTAASSRFPRFSQQLSRSGLLVSRAFRGGDERGDAWLLFRTEIRAPNSFDHSRTREAEDECFSTGTYVPVSSPSFRSIFFFRPFVSRERPRRTRTNDDISDATVFVSKLIAPRQERTMAYCNFLLQRKSETKRIVISEGCARARARPRERNNKYVCVRCSCLRTLFLRIVSILLRCDVCSSLPLCRSL